MNIFWIFFRALHCTKAKVKICQNQFLIRTTLIWLEMSKLGSEKYQFFMVKVNYFLALFCLYCFLHWPKAKSSKMKVFAFTLKIIFDRFRTSYVIGSSFLILEFLQLNSYRHVKFGRFLPLIHFFFKNCVLYLSNGCIYKVK